MKLGIIGLPNVGKSTLFNAMTKAGAMVANYPFCTISPNVGMAFVHDKRLDILADMCGVTRKTYASIEFFDIAGLVKGASAGEGLGNKFLSNIREADALIHVIRCFNDENIPHIDPVIDPVRDIEIINLELLLSDIEVLQRRADKIRKSAKSGDKRQMAEANFCDTLLRHLEKGDPARSFPVEGEEFSALIASFFLLTSKPVLYVANISETDIAEPLDNPHVSEALRYIRNDTSDLLAICAKTEEEIALLENSEKYEYLEILGLQESGLDRLIRSSYSLLGYISFLTAENREARAWTVINGTKAQKAAGKIHSDFERGFIRAEVISFDQLECTGSFVHAREKGLVRSEGKDYIVKDGDVILFRFNV